MLHNIQSTTGFAAISGKLQLKTIGIILDIPASLEVSKIYEMLPLDALTFQLIGCHFEDAENPGFPSSRFKPKVDIL